MPVLYFDTQPKGQVGVRNSGSAFRIKERHGVDTAINRTPVLHL